MMDSSSSSNAPTANPAPFKVLVLGLGNDVLTDDAIGLHAARELERQFAGDLSIHVCATTEMGLALLDFLTGYDAAVLLDSIQTGRAAPGFIHELDAASLEQLSGGTPHFLGVGETLALGQQLGLRMPAQVRIFAIEVEDPFTLGTQLTPALQTALPGIVMRIVGAVRAIVERGRGTGPG